MSTYAINAFGVMAVRQSILDLLQASDAPRIVNVSSSQGLLVEAANPASKYYIHKGAIYQSSEAALNMLTILAYELRDTRVKVNVETSPTHNRTATVRTALQEKPWHSP